MTVNVNVNVNVNVTGSVNGNANANASGTVNGIVSVTEIGSGNEIVNETATRRIEAEMPSQLGATTTSIVVGIVTIKTAVAVIETRTQLVEAEVAVGRQAGNAIGRYLAVGAGESRYIRQMEMHNTKFIVRRGSFVSAPCLSSQGAEASESQSKPWTSVVSGETVIMDGTILLPQFYSTRYDCRSHFRLGIPRPPSVPLQHVHDVVHPHLVRCSRVGEEKRYRRQ